VSENVPGAPPSSRTPILDNDEVANRTLLLTELRAALAEFGVRCVLARRHRLVLRYGEKAPLEPSGLTDPTLHVVTPDGTRVASTDGAVYRLDTGQEFAASDPAAAATMIRDALEPAVLPVTSRSGAAR
jgi:hypothetical protein